MTEEKKPAMSGMSKGRRVLFLYWYFARIGAFTFGGGWSIIAQMQLDFVEKRRWLADEEILDLTSIGRSLPGVMIGNVAFLFGHRFAGTLGGVAAVLGMNTAPFLVLLLLTGVYEQFRANLYVERVLRGVRAAVLPIMCSAALKLRKSGLKDAGGWLLALGAFALCAFTNVSRVLIVVMGAAAGLAIEEVRARGVR